MAGMAGNTHAHLGIRRAMIEHLSSAQIDRVWWDDVLSRCTNRSWYAQSWLLDLASPGWEALVDRTRGAVMPLTAAKRWGMAYLRQPYGLQQLGVFAPALDQALCEEMVKAVPERYRYCDILLNSSMVLPSLPGIRLEPMSVQELRLEGGIDALRAAYSTGHKRNLKKSADAGVSLREDITPAAFRALFARTTARRYGGLGSDRLDLMERTMEQAMLRGQCTVIGLEGPKGPIAAAVFMHYAGRIILYKSAVDEAGRDARGLFRIVDAMVARHAESGHVLDFAGSNAASVARFNEGFGARTGIYLRLVRNRLPRLVAWIKH